MPTGAYEAGDPSQWGKGGELPVEVTLKLIPEGSVGVAQMGRERTAEWN